ncbi:MAG TPA: hypothetical protein VL485_06075 [Ktedonobacteraceae bacterium]|nr:hypothetical protein [Ktedonobacteraceae bacterium]
MNHSTKMSYVISGLALFIVALILLLLLAFSMSFSFDDPALRPIPTPMLTGTDLNSNVSTPTPH